MASMASRPSPSPSAGKNPRHQQHAPPPPLPPINPPFNTAINSPPPPLHVALFTQGVFGFAPPCARAFCELLLLPPITSPTREAVMITETHLEGEVGDEPTRTGTRITTSTEPTSPPHLPPRQHPPPPHRPYNRNSYLPPPLQVITALNHLNSSPSPRHPQHAHLGSQDSEFLQGDSPTSQSHLLRRPGLLSLRRENDPTTHLLLQGRRDEVKQSNSGQVLMQRKE